MAGAAPAWAASTCVGANTYSQALWATTSTYTTATAANMRYKTTETGVTQAKVTSITSTFTGSATKDGALDNTSTVMDNNCNVTATSSQGFGGIYVNQPFYYVGHYFQDAWPNAFHTVTITFDKPVYCLSFWITDIDANWLTNGGRHSDYLEVASSTASFSVSSGSATTNLTMTNSSGVGQPATVVPTNIPAAANSTYEWAATSGKGNACFTASGPVTSFTIKHGSTIFRPSFQNAQQVYLSPLTYRTTALAPGCTCPKCITTALP